MPRQRFNKLPAEKREQIMQTAGKEFALYGYEDASLNRILETVGMSKGAAYYYFDDKTDLFAAVLSHYVKHITEIGEINADELTSETFWPTLIARYSAPGARISESPWMMGLFRALYNLSASVRERDAMKAYVDQIWSWFTVLIKRGQELGVVRTDLPDDLLFALVTGLDGASDQWLMDHWDELAPEQAESLLRRVAEMIRLIMSP
jgi:AcrR family transcriptional regulator